MKKEKDIELRGSNASQIKTTKKFISTHLHTKLFNYPLLPPPSHHLSHPIDLISITIFSTTRSLLDFQPHTTKHRNKITTMLTTSLEHFT